jgi:hypothetical protein
VYRTKPGLENTHVITALAISIYGSDYKRAIDLLDPGDQESNLTNDVIITLPGESEVVTAICNLLESLPEAIELALGAMTTYPWTASVLLEKLQEIPDKNEVGTSKIIRVIVSHLSDEQSQAFSKLGGLPDLALYNLDCFETLWEKTGQELTDIVALFEKLHLIRGIKEDQWKIKPQVLEIAKQYLEALPNTIQLRAQNWWRRILDKPKYLDAFRSHLISRRAELDQLADSSNTKKQLDEKHRPFVTIDTDWTRMQSLSQYMSYENFVFAQFLLIRRKRDFLYGFLISLWLGSAALMHQVPQLMACAIGAGVYAFLHLLIDLYRCDSAWGSLWETLVARARSAREGG